MLDTQLRESIFLPQGYTVTEISGHRSQGKLKLKRFVFPE